MAQEERRCSSWFAKVVITDDNAHDIWEGLNELDIRSGQLLYFYFWRNSKLDGRARRHSFISSLIRAKFSASGSGLQCPLGLLLILARLSSERFLSMNQRPEILRRNVWR